MYSVECKEIKKINLELEDHSSNSNNNNNKPRKPSITCAIERARYLKSKFYIRKQTTL